MRPPRYPSQRVIKTTAALYAMRLRIREVLTKAAPQLHDLLAAMDDNLQAPDPETALVSLEGLRDACDTAIARTSYRRARP